MNNMTPKQRKTFNDKLLKIFISIPLSLLLSIVLSIYAEYLFFKIVKELEK